MRRLFPWIACVVGPLSFALTGEAGWVQTTGKLVVDDYPSEDVSLIGQRGDYSAPAVGDLNGDGRPDLVAITYGDGLSKNTYLHAWHNDGTPMAGWPVVLNAFYANPQLSTVALGDLDGIRGDEVIVTESSYCRPYVCTGTSVFRFDGTRVPIGPPTGIFQGFALKTHVLPVIGDLNGDGINEVVVTGQQGILAWNRNGILAGWPVDLPSRYGEPDPSTEYDPELGYGLLGASPALADLDKDGTLEVIAATRQRVYAWRHDGREMAGWPVALRATGRVNASPVVANFQGNGAPTVAILAPPEEGSGEPTGRVLFLGPNGALLGNPGRSYAVQIDRTPTPADLNGDGTHELLVARTGGLDGLTSVSLATSGAPAFQGLTFGPVRAAPVVARLKDGSRRVYAAGDDGRLYAWDATGKPVKIGTATAALPLELGTKPLSPLLVDLERDGVLELVLMGRGLVTEQGISTKQSLIRVIRLRIEGVAEWATLKGDVRRTGALSWLPNLVISDLVYSPAQPRTVLPTTIIAVVTNVGGSASGYARVMLRVGTEGASPQYAIPPLPAGASYPVVRQLWLRTMQTTQVTATADSVGQVKESDEADNVRIKPLVVLP